MLSFYGEGLYEDPELGWGDVAAEVVPYAVPGEHTNNRQLMNEPYAGAIAGVLEDALG
jgi:hypothetical protein